MKFQSTFMAWITRMPLIKRWALMHCVQKENVAEHSHQVAVIAHLLTVIGNTRYNNPLDPDRAAVIALYHEVSETKLQDINSKTKYHNPQFTQAFKQLETLAEQECIETLSAYIKALNELRFHNDEFIHVKEGLESRISELRREMPEVDDFMEIFCASCTTTLDKISEHYQ